MTRNAIESRERTIKQSRLTMNDFGSSIKEELQPVVKALVDHYNGENIFFGLPNRL